MNKLLVFKNRLKKIGIEVELAGNLPWVYLLRVNKKAVLEEDWDANHGFTIGFLKYEFNFAKLKRIFELIRKYK